MLCVYQWQKTKRDMIYFFLFVAGFHRSIYLLQKANDLLRGVKGLQRGLIYLKRDKNLEKYTFL
jgi:DNA primase